LSRDSYCAGARARDNKMIIVAALAYQKAGRLVW
jgi:hypothetical protein